MENNMAVECKTKFLVK